MTIIYRWLAWGFVGICALGFVGIKAYIAGSDNAHNADSAAMAAPASVTAFFLLARDETALAEKTYTACLMVSLGALAVPPMVERMLTRVLPS